MDCSLQAALLAHGVDLQEVEEEVAELLRQGLSTEEVVELLSEG